MRQFFFTLVLFIVVTCVQGWAADEFAMVRCGADVGQAMVGKRSSNERVVVIEARHKDLGLKDLGASEISDQLFLIFWRICNSEYAELVNTKNGLIRAVLPLPAESLFSPHAVLEECQVAGKTISDAGIVVLDNSNRQRPKDYNDHIERIMLPGKMAWRIDEVQERFVPMPTQGLSCPMNRSSLDLK